MIHQYDGQDDTYELLDSIESDEFMKELKDIDLDTCTINNENLDRKPASKVRPIKHTHVHDTSDRSVNVDPVVTGSGMIGREGYRAISGRSITQEINPGRKVITHGNIIKTDITDTRKIPPRSGGGVSFLIGEKQKKAFMFASLGKALLTSNQNVGATSIPRTRRINQGRILAPTMYENVPCRNDVRSTVLNNVRKSDELDTTIDRLTTNENDTACLQNVEDTPKGIFHENIKKFDPSSRVNFADSSFVKTPELVPLRDLPVDTDDVPDNAGVPTGITEKDGIWFSNLREIGGTAATHDDLKEISEMLKFK